MFKSMAADLAGTSDNCHPIKLDKFADPNEVGDSLSFLKKGERPFIFLKSKIFEFIFTDLALIRIERDNSGGVKRFTTRYEWQFFTLQASSMKFTSAGAGMTDYACEIDFCLGDSAIHIEIIKSESDYAKLIYLTLLELGTEQYRNKLMLNEAQTLKSQVLINASDAASFANMQILASQEIISKFVPVSYASIFEKNMSE